MNPAYRDFEFDLPEALLQRLVQVLDDLEPAPLTQLGLEGVPDAQGVYQLFKDGVLVYVGKTDSEAGLRRRLSRHAQKILHRIGLSPEQVSYKAVRIYVFTAIDLETQLIRHYAGKGGTAWNNSGFGANDPGRKRDHTRVKSSNFDAIYPIDIDRPLDVSFADCTSAAQALSRAKLAIPYNLRFESGHARRPHEDLLNAPLSLEDQVFSLRGLLAAVARSLPAGWQATALPGYVLLYKEQDDTYPDGQVLART
ncbi:MAG TPA: GIY-YIG nuclease family protein [Caulobacter sp.]|nr:GIY-YIG nuclease family protein [Caulobacter sp.]